MNKILDGMQEALEVAQGNIPAARMTINGHTYVPEGTVLAAEWRTDWDNAPRDGTDILIGGWANYGGAGGPFQCQVVGAWDVEEAGGDGGWTTNDGLNRIEEHEAFVPEFWMLIPKMPPR